MDTGKVVKTHKNVPAPIPVQIPNPGKQVGDCPTENPQKETGQPIPISLPTRKEQEVEV